MVWNMELELSGKKSKREKASFTSERTNWVFHFDGSFTSERTNWVFHFDGLDKSMGFQNNTFPIAIYGCLDTARRKFVWIKVLDINRSPYLGILTICMNRNFGRIMLDLTREQRLCMPVYRDSSMILILVVK